MVVGSWKRTPFVCVPLQVARWRRPDQFAWSADSGRSWPVLSSASTSINRHQFHHTHTHEALAYGRTYTRFFWRQVAKVKKLKPRDAAQLLVDKVPTRFTKAELGLPSDCTREDILAVLEAHPVLQAADGHPGTLVRVPSSV